MARVSYTIIETKLGWIGMVGSEAGLCRITWLRHEPLGLSSGRRLSRTAQASPEAIAGLLTLKEVNIDASAFGDLPERLRRYFMGERVRFPDKLDLRDATPFQYAVWEVTRSIPYGETRSYIWVAREIGRPKAARAVGQALAANPFPIVIPCHRVIRSDGSLGGYGAGVEMKRHLLNMETRQTKK